MLTASGRARLTRYYYFATPLFLAADLMWDAPLRVSFVSDPKVRFAYYAACIGCGLVMWRAPRWTRPIGMTESLINFTLVILSIMVPVFSAPEAILAGVDPVLDPMRPINAGISGAAFLGSYYSYSRPR